MLVFTVCTPFAVSNLIFGTSLLRRLVYFTLFVVRCSREMVRLFQNELKDTLRCRNWQLLQMQSTVYNSVF